MSESDIREEVAPAAGAANGGASDADDDHHRPGRLDRLERELDRALEELEKAPAWAKMRYQEAFYAAAADLLDSRDGIERLYARADRFDGAGVFETGPWEDPSKLLPDLVGVGLRGEGVYPTLEALSELRMLALAAGRVQDGKLEPGKARKFLREVCAKNLDLMFPRETEDSRARPKIYARAQRLFALIRDNISIEGLREKVVEEIDLLCAQRPIQTSRTRELIALAEKLPGGDGSSDTQGRLDLYRKSTGAVTPLSIEAGSPSSYRVRLRDLGPDELLAESRAFASTLHATGLASPYHAVVLRQLARLEPSLVGEGLGLGDTGLADANRAADLVVRLVRMAIFPHTASALLGLAGVLERGLLSRNEVAGGLRRIMELDIRPDVTEVLLDRFPDAAGLSSSSVLLGGCLSVLGQPLGIGQGNNPTCQAARGLSLWSLHAPGLLLGMIANAARDGFVTAEFEGQQLRSDELEPGLAKDGVDLDLDPVSKLLVPHLDRIYSRMMAVASLRGEDAHKWVNPAMYGRWVSSGFASAFDVRTNVVRHHQAFVRRFYATHHPDYNDGYELIYPNPVGIMVTDVHGGLLGPHAVSIQRIAESPEGELRIYFFNPNNEGRQEWGQGVSPTVSGHGERPGESSLPFPHFVSRMYAFHYDPMEEGDAYAVPDRTVKEVSRMAAESWGRTHTWMDE
jgi:hypothetical protein